MAAEMQAGLPPDCHLASGYTVRLTALDATGNPVAGVSLSGVAFFVHPVASPGSSGPDDTPAPLLVPVDDSA